jgi:hypothetical protein
MLPIAEPTIVAPMHSVQMASMAIGKTTSDCKNSRYARDFDNGNNKSSICSIMAGWTIPFLVKVNVIAVGAQVERRGDAWPVRNFLDG